MIDSTKRALKVFLCHASADKPTVRKLYRYLKQRGIQPWLDEIDILPGQNWQVEIPNALFSSDVIIVCISKNSVDKEGYVQKEISFALDKALEKPEGTIFVIPAKLEECSVPSRLSHFHWVDLFRDGGHKRLMQSLNLRAASLGTLVTQALVTEDTQPGFTVSDLSKFEDSTEIGKPIEEHSLEMSTSLLKQEEIELNAGAKSDEPKLETSKIDSPIVAPEPKIQKKKTLPRTYISLFGIVGIILIGLACSLIGGFYVFRNSFLPFSSMQTPTSTIKIISETPPPTDDGSNKVLLEDDFSSKKWGTGTDADSAVEYVDNTLNFHVISKNFIVWTTPNDKDYENVHMEVTVINNGTDSTTAFGLICDQQHPITDSHYYFAVTAGGQYAIAKAAYAQKDVFLTNNDKWADSDLIAKDAASYRVGADCGNGKLTLYVDGQQIASVDDSTYTSGGFAVFVWSGKDAATTNVSFDDFKMTKLP